MKEDMYEKYLKLFYSMIKHAIVPTPEFLNWHSRLPVHLQKLLNNFNDDFKDSLPFWVQYGFLEKLKYSVSMDDLKKHLNINTLTKNLLEANISQLLPVLDDWCNYITNVNYDIIKNLDTSDLKLNLSDTIFFDTSRDNIRRVKSYLDIQNIEDERLMADSRANLPSHRNDF